MSEGITDIEESQIQTNYDKVVYKFDDMELDENLLRGVFGYGFEEPSAIQQRAIMPIIEGHDVLAQAQSGTGKTGTFSIAALQRIDTSVKAPQALMLAPTRELAVQIQTSVVLPLLKTLKVWEMLKSSLVLQVVFLTTSKDVDSELTRSRCSS